MAKTKRLRRFQIDDEFVLGRLRSGTTIFSLGSHLALEAKMRTTCRIALVLILAWVCVFPWGGAPAIAEGEVAKHLIGTWRLVSFNDPTGKSPRGPNPTG